MLASVEPSCFCRGNLLVFFERDGLTTGDEAVGSSKVGFARDVENQSRGLDCGTQDELDSGMDELARMSSRQRRLAATKKALASVLNARV